MSTFLYIIIGLSSVFAILYFLYKKGKQVKDKEREDAPMVLKNTGGKRKKYRYSGNAYRDFKKKPIYKKQTDDQNTYGQTATDKND